MLSHQHNYNRILQVFPTIDSTVIKTDSLQLADAIKKASIGITRHPYSNWTDDNYIIVGKTRLYQADFVNAVETFKYVNTTSENDNERHTALIFLMRTFVENRDFSNAIAVSDFLEKQELNRRNRKLLYLTRAHFHQVRENLDGIVENLTLVAPMLKRNEEKAKIYFIIGQIYQELGLDVKAYEYYQKCTKTNPEYELFFYARLNMNQVAVLDGSSDIKRVRKYYRKLLKDDKNIDFQDKIYYEMGRFEQKQGNLELAIENYKSSALTSTNNPRQKSYAYWELGKIYFTDLKDYELAKAYYDSTVMVMPEDEEAFAAIKQRQEVLAEFVEHVTTIAQTDSVLALANMDSIARAAIFAKVIEQEEAAAAEEDKRQRRAARQQQFVNLDEAGTGTFAGGPQAGSVWYYYNPTAITSGQADFRRTWGERPLERNWRRSNKGLEEGGFGDVDPALAAEQDAETENSVPIAELSPEERRAKRQQELLNKLPLTAEAQQTAYAKLEFAYYRLGDIYREDLEEPVNAIPPFESLLNRFDTSQYAPEVMYQLYLIYQPVDLERSNYYKNLLINQYPNTIYAKVIINPNYQEESNAAAAKAQRLYREAYQFYETQAFTEAGTLVSQGLNDFPENDFTDNFALLKILIEAEQGTNIYNYRFALEGFKTDYPESELLGYAEKLLEASQSVETRIQQAKAIQYISYFDQEHYFVLVYKNASAEATDITQQIDQFNKATYPDVTLATSSLILNDEYSMVLVAPFTGKQDALAYYNAFIQDNSTLNGLQRFNFNNFVITKDNFTIYLQAKKPDSYKTFYQQNYLRLE